MKEVDIKIWEIEKKEVPKLPDKTKILLFNTLFRDFNLVSADRLVPKLPKLSKFNKFFCLDEPSFNDSPKKSQNKTQKRN